MNVAVGVSVGSSQSDYGQYRAWPSFRRRHSTSDRRTAGPARSLSILPQFHAIPENDGWWGRGFHRMDQCHQRRCRGSRALSARVCRGRLAFMTRRIAETLRRQATLAKQARHRRFSASPLLVPWPPAAGAAAGNASRQSGYRSAFLRELGERNLVAALGWPRARRSRCPRVLPGGRSGLCAVAGAAVS